MNPAKIGPGLKKPLHWLVGHPLALCGEPLMSQDPTLGKPFLQDSSLLCCAVVTIWWIKDGKIRRRLTAASEINILLTFRFQICQTVDPSVVSGKAP